MIECEQKGTNNTQTTLRRSLVGVRFLIAVQQHHKVLTYREGSIQISAVMVRRNKKKNAKKRQQGGGRSNSNTVSAAAPAPAAAPAITAATTYWDPLYTPTTITKNTQPDPNSETFAMCGREVPIEVYTDVRNKAYGGILQKFGRGIPAGLVLDATTGTVSPAWCKHIFDAAFEGCCDSVVTFYCNAPHYLSERFLDLNAKCGDIFANKVANDITKLYAAKFAKTIVKSVGNTTTNTKEDVPVPPQEYYEKLIIVSPTTQQQVQRYAMGTVISKVCVEDGIAYQGHIITYDPKFGLYRVQYDDGDQEEFDEEEVAQYRIRGAKDEDEDKEKDADEDRDDSDDNDKDDTSGGTGTAVASISVAATRTNNVATSDHTDDDDLDEKKNAAKQVCTTDRLTIDDTDDDKKPAAQQDSTTDREIVSPLTSLKQDEKMLGGIFAFHDYTIEFDLMKRNDCISDELMRTLIANESDDACAHGHTSDQYHISRAMEVLLFLAQDSYTGPAALTLAVARQAGVTFEDATADPDFAQFLVSTVTNLIRIDPDLERDKCFHFGFCTTFLRKALEIKHRLQLTTAINSNNEEQHVGLRHLYDHKLLKYQRDVVSTRGVINICYRETKDICDCMKPLRVAGKLLDKRRPCFGCRELFPKKDLPYCRGCAFHEYCSYKCSIQKCWVVEPTPNQEHTCAMRDYIRCSTCRVLFPSNELSMHTCIFTHNITPAETEVAEEGEIEDAVVEVEAEEVDTTPPVLDLPLPPSTTAAESRFSASSLLSLDTQEDYEDDEVAPATSSTTNSDSTEQDSAAVVSAPEDNEENPNPNHAQTLVAEQDDDDFDALVRQLDELRKNQGTPNNRLMEPIDETVKEMRIALESSNSRYKNL